MNKQNVKKYSVTDVGSGAGHFLKALEQKNKRNRIRAKSNTCYSWKEETKIE